MQLNKVINEIKAETGRYIYDMNQTVDKMISRILDGEIMNKIADLQLLLEVQEINESNL